MMETPLMGMDALQPVKLKQRAELQLRHPAVAHVLEARYAFQVLTNGANARILALKTLMLVIWDHASKGIASVHRSKAKIQYAPV